MTVAAALLGVGCRKPAPLNILLVTFDTARADRFGAFGAPAGATPAVDALAARGVAFEQAVSPVPLTLPAHASLFTGTYPPSHGVRENGGRSLAADRLTLAEILHDAGYATGAFVGAYVLDARWGLAQGFDTYSGSFDATAADVLSLADLSRTADRVVDDAIAWLETVDGRPFFAWVHLYDPHAPYTPPAEYSRRFPNDPYAGEIAFADAQLGRLLSFLDRRTPRDRLLVIVAGDHGEAFGEHGETGHGLLLYGESLHVPLVLSGGPLAPASRRIAEPVSLVDVLPTVCELAGLPVPAAAQGRSLGALNRSASREKTPVPIYAETLYPGRFGWSELRSLRVGDWHLIQSSENELYDLADDPHETRDLAAAKPAELRETVRSLAGLRAKLESGPAAASEAVALDEAARLRALGYLAGAPAAPPAAAASAPNPRRKIVVYEQLLQARQSLADGDLAGAEQQAAAIVEHEPAMAEARIALGEVLLRERRFADAAAAFRTALGQHPGDPTLLSALATAELQAGRPDAALAALEPAIRDQPQEPRFHFLAGRAHLLRQEVADARREFAEGLRLNPRSAAALVELAGVAVVEGDAAQAVTLAQRALAIDPRARGAHLVWGQALDRLHDDANARVQVETELAAWPDDFRAAFLLGELAERRADAAVAEASFRRAIALEPRFAVAHLRLARRLLERGGDPSEGVGLARRALELGVQGEDRALAYYLLADFYSRLGETARSRQNARLAKESLHHDH